MSAAQAVAAFVISTAGLALSPGYALAAVGDITEYSIPTASSQPASIAVGPDGNLWFAEFNANKVAKVTTSGAFTEYTVPTAGSGPRGIVAGPDGNVWFTEFNANKVAKATTAGSFTEYTVPTVSSGPASIAAGPDGNLWFTELNANNVAKISAGTAPTLTSIAVSPTNPTIPSGTDQQFTATGTYSDASTTDLTSSVTWASATPAVATISSGGLGHAVSSGTSTISATLGAVSGDTVLTVGPAPNSAPVAVNDTYGANQGNSLAVPVATGVLANDTDPDAGTTLGAILVTGTTHGTLTLASDGSFLYTPVADFSGSDTFAYRASDGSLTSNLATVTINVTGVTSIIASQPKLTSGQKSSLEDKLAAAETFFDSGKLNPACGKLSDFITQVDGLTPSKLSSATATVLIDSANALKTLYGCPG